MTAPALTLTITQAGQAALAAAQLAQANGQLAIATLGLTAQPFVAAPTINRLPGEVRRVASISGALVGDQTVHLVLRDDDPVTYSASGFGLYLTDGTLFAVYSQPNTLLEKSAQVSLMAAIDVAFPVVGVDHLTFGDANWLNPPATSTTAGVLPLATQAEVEDGAVATKAVTPATLAARLSEVVTSLLAQIAHAVADYVPLAQKAQPSGVATLDSTGKVPLPQIPVAGILAPGSIMLFFGAAAPAGWAICDGRTVPLADGSGTITTPDLRGRVAVGVSDDHALGSAFGSAVREVQTTNSQTGLLLHYSTSSAYAGGGTQAAVAAGALGQEPSLTDNGHTHGVTVDVTQPSLALIYIIKL